MTLMFTHKATGAWDALAKGLMEAGFVITASWPVNTEAGGSLHIRDKAAANSTVFLACRPRPAERAAEARDAVVYWEDVEPRVANAVRTRVAEFQQAGIAGVDLYLACFGPALEEFSRNWPLTRGTPRERPAARRGQQDVLEDDWDPYAATPEDALDAARREVKRWRLEQLTRKKASEDLDAPTAFFVLAWDAFKAPVFAYDEALRLARAVGVDMDAQVAKRLGEKRGGDFRLWDSATRAAKGALGPVDGSRGLVDTLHHAASISRSRSLAAARDMLADTGMDQDARLFRRSRRCWKCCRCRTASRRCRCKARPPRPATISRRCTTLPGWRMRRRWISRSSWSCGWGKHRFGLLSIHDAVAEDVRLHVPRRGGWRPPATPVHHGVSPITFDDVTSGTASTPNATGVKSLRNPIYSCPWHGHRRCRLERCMTEDLRAQITPDGRCRRSVARQECVESGALALCRRDSSRRWLRHICHGPLG